MEPDAKGRRFTFSKAERLCSKIAFDHLYKHGAHLRAGVLNFFYLFDFPEEMTEAPVMVALSVPKKHFKRAVDRNHLKRRMREAYRLNKHLLIEPLQPKQRNLVFVISYGSKKQLDFHSIEQMMVKGFKQVLQQSAKGEDNIYRDN